MSIYDRKKTFHFIGIGGVGMSGLADLLLEMGHRVTGSDRQRSALTDYLADRGAIIFEGHDAANLEEADFVIYSSAIPLENPEMAKAGSLKIPRIRRAELLGQFMSRKLGIAVAGTHGKTTTTSMIGEILVRAGLDPTVIVGGRMRNSMTNARLGKGELLVTEADEYDRSFLTLYPRIAILTSLESDHMDIYNDLHDIKSTFVRFANQTPFDGVVICYADDPNVFSIMEGIERTKLTYGMGADADYRCTDISFSGEVSHFTVLEMGKELGTMGLKVPGRHNVLYALAAVAVCRELDIPFPGIREGLEAFGGVERRFEFRGMEKEVYFYDDYAHHPTEVQATLSAARQGWKRRIVAVFQPHLFSRTRDFYREFAGVLAEADVVILTGIYPAREEPIPGVSSTMIFDALKEQGHDAVYYVEDKEALPAFIRDHARAGDMVITMGAGDIWHYGEKTIDLCRQKS